eukprot:CAMPEP_0174269536 /NCGR_PEP_ID=MMETSP0439-20130205/41404_1 /TAXON_ID=0 /ORGANISM="Stereomyxa ramosa, Strain Chinc5" /LENGTH=386 /DNA_ID=CAMNT_0015358375 /DNA_START=20 /DNA_END=1180 /DNA_ORIENTATION=-
MKLLNKLIDKDGGGSFVLRPEQLEDMWHAYNLILVGDLISASTARRVVRSSNTGSVASERVRTTLTLRVEKIEFDPEAGLLRVNGVNVRENKYVKMGAHHTIDLSVDKKFTVTKDYWDSIALERVEIACDPSKSAEMGAVVMSEGTAYVCLLTENMTITQAKVDTNIPRKRKVSSTLHDKGVKRFFENVMQAILLHYNFDVLKCVIIASPGFTKDQFFTYMQQEATKRDLKVLKDNFSKFILAHSNSGHRYAIKELMQNPEVLEKMQDTKAAAEVRAMEAFYEMMKQDPDRAFYGLSDITQANEKCAIDTLLIVDELFRSQSISQRKMYVNIVESVRENGGTVLIFSALHVSGEQLKSLGGIAAILRFPLPDVEHEMSSDSESDTD